MVNQKKLFSTGHWPSWVTPELVAGKNISFSEIKTVQNWVFWLEGRPEENGRSVVVGRSPEGNMFDLTPPERKVGTRVHEYGGGAWDVRLKNNIPEVIYSDSKEGGVWLSFDNKTKNIIKNEDKNEKRYADLKWDNVGKGFFCIKELHKENIVESTIFYISLEGQETVLDKGNDFYAAPRLSPDGKYLAWFTWNNPEMPWTVTQLYVASFSSEKKTLGSAICLNFGKTCSIIEPRWADEKTLYATSDENGRWTPVRFTHQNEEWVKDNLPDAGAEIGLPHWVFGQRTYVPLTDSKIIALGIENGLNKTFLYCGKEWKKINLGAPFNVPEPLENGMFAWIDTPENAPPALALGDLETGKFDRFKVSVRLPDGIMPDDISIPKPITFTTKGGIEAYALFYAPTSSKYSLIENEKPPLVVIVHGGPTGRSNPGFAFKVQWWTSRGFAVLDVNYRGSTGFGRKYRELLDGEWGVADVEDCIAGAQAVIDQGWVDPKRCVIRGSSAGGLTVLSALAQSSVFVAGTSLYGVTDLRALVAETHKFEARYLDSLIGPYPEKEQVYVKRSPLTQADKINVPVLFLHGGNDKVVPLSQAELMKEKLKDSSLHIYPEEGHGFREKEVIEDALVRELNFYQSVFK
ncbi:S9 family peptidase [Swingsia samuiensis]|uniref:S9 family peptidase n=1 Tax=Swingsia samuiensis TaxID=1293412 RepID=A0A4Y6UK88_9PROT|nr:prolyl oligopeptidase family serine peptidase [Swingsia samuiensis]QDH16886.1 S9 family peptidase [Swingsia samuiensis]